MDSLRSPPQIQKTIIETGTFGRKPALGWKCLVRVKVENSVPSEVGTEYLKGDCTGEITIGNADWPLDKAIESCVETMHVGEESKFRVRLASSFQTNVIISLVSCSEKDYFFHWTDEAKLEACKSFKADGVELFKSSRIDHAFYKFSKAIKMMLLMDLDFNDEDQQLFLDDVLMSLYNNLASCQLHFKNYSWAIDLCTKSLNIKSNVKGFYRRALAYIELNQYYEAEDDLKELLKIEPKNRAAVEKYKLVRVLNKTNKDNYQTIVKNMFR